jgi:antitoxin ParD1/3/4
MTSLTTMNISLPEPMKAFVDKKVDQGGYSTSSEYVRELIRKDQDRAKLREALLAGAASPLLGPMDKAYFEDLRKSIRKRAAKK